MNIWSALLSAAGLPLAPAVLVGFLSTIALRRRAHKDVVAVPEDLAAPADVFGVKGTLNSRLPNAWRIVTLSVGDAEEVGEGAGYGTASRNRIVGH